MGRRGSKTQSNMNIHATGPLEETPIEDDNGDGRSLSAKRAQRKTKKGSFIRKLKNSFRNSISMSEQREDSEVLNDPALQMFHPATAPLAAAIAGTRTANNIHSPAYTADDSLLSIEVSGRTWQ
jgi:hypothetical protein